MTTRLNARITPHHATLSNREVIEMLARPVALGLGALLLLAALVYGVSSVFDLAKASASTPIVAGR